jgi:tetratricopeptide (TPR) repeat protein
VYAYPYFVPTFSFGLSFWDTPDYYSYYTEPAVVYTQPTTIVESPTYYSEPAPYYADSGTTYVQTETYGAPVESGTTYVEKRVETQYGTPGVTSAPPTIGMPPTAPPASAPPASQQPAPQGEAPVKQPDQRVLAAVGQGNEHFGAGRYAEARKAYGEAMGIDDTDGVAMLLFGLASFAEGDFATAGTVTMKALDATPDLIYYPFNIKALYRNSTKFQEHVNALARRVDSDPGDDQARFLLGYMWYASGDAQNAKVVFESLAASKPSEELYPALRDAATQAIEMMAKQPQSAPTKPAPQ